MEFIIPVSSRTQLYPGSTHYYLSSNAFRTSTRTIHLYRVSQNYTHSTSNYVAYFPVEVRFAYLNNTRMSARLEHCPKIGEIFSNASFSYIRKGGDCFSSFSSGDPANIRIIRPNIFQYHLATLVTISINNSLCKDEGIFFFIYLRKNCPWANTC